MSSDELVRLSADFSQLNELAQGALIREIARRGLKDSGSEAAGKGPEVLPSKDPKSNEPPLWNYQTMSDEELQQLCAAYQKLHQPISESLRREMDLRVSRQSGLAAIPQPSLPSLVAPEISVELSQQQKTPPYGRFVLQFLFFCLFASICIFALVEASARNTTAFEIEALSLLLTVALGWRTWKTWRRILRREPRDETKSKSRVRNTAVTCVIFIFVYLGLAALLGSVIGQNRADVLQFSLDADHQKQLADRITTARTSVSGTIPAFLTMYAAIESDVKDYSETLYKVREDLEKYDSKFPAQHEATRKLIASNDREIRRSDLLTKQISAAKQIVSLDETAQATAWQNEMMPLLQEEDALDQAK
jgi:hypothetical protein